MINQLPIVFKSSYEDEKLRFIIEGYFKNSCYNKNYTNLPELIADKFENYLDTFVFNHHIYPLDFTVHMEFEHSSNVLSTKYLIEDLAKQYGCNCLDKCATAIAFSTQRDIPIMLASIIGAFTRDEKNNISNCMFFIIAPVP